jgi:hypothetical protein
MVKVTLRASARKGQAVWSRIFFLDSLDRIGRIGYWLSCVLQDIEPTRRLLVRPARRYTNNVLQDWCSDKPWVD